MSRHRAAGIGTITAAAIGAIGWGLAASWYIATEQTIYFWDYVQWWHLSLTLLQDLQTSVTTALRSVVNSLDDDYSLMPVVPLAGWCGLFGPSRLAFVTGITTIYGGPLAAAVFLLVDCAAQAARGGYGILPRTAAVVVAACWPLPFGTSMRGFVDCGGSALACTILWLSFATPHSRLSVWRCFAIGGLLALLVLFRRYWSIWLVSFCVLVALDTAWQCWQRRKSGWQAMFTMLLPPLAIGGVAAATLVTLAPGLVRRVLNTNYADVYVAYQFAGTSGWWDRLPKIIAGVVAENGLVYAAAGVGSLGYLLVTPAYRRIGVALAGLTVLPLLLFQRVQAPGLHHHLLWSTTLMLAAAITAMDVLGRQQSQPSRFASRRAFLTFAGIAVVAAAQWAAAIVPAAAPLRPLLLTGSGQLPLVRDDLAELDRLIDAIDAEAIKRQGKVRIYCLASSATLNAGILSAYGPSRQRVFRAQPMVAQTYDIDLRDGFPMPLVSSNLLVVTDPPQVHQGVEHQQVIVVPTKQVLNGTGFGAAFRRPDPPRTHRPGRCCCGSCGPGSNRSAAFPAL